MDIQRYIKERQPVSSKWDEIRSYMDTHIFGANPERLLRNRRPLESTNSFALQYRLDNFQPITKEPFNLAISSIIEVADQLSINIVGLEPDTEDYLADYRINIAGKDYNVKEFFTSYIGKMAEADPNGCVVVMPVHPTQEFIPQYDAELPNFEAVKNQRIDTDIIFVSSADIHYRDEKNILFVGGDWIYRDGDKDESAPYFWHLTADETVLYYPYKDDKQVVYVPYLYYLNMTEKPLHRVIGDNRVVEEITYEKGQFLSQKGRYTVEYQESHFSGAVAIGNSVIGIWSDSQIIDARFTYAEKIASYQACDNNCSKYLDVNSPFTNKNVIYNADGSCSICSKCNGTGRVKPDTTPLGTHIMVKEDMFDDAGKFIPPVFFVDPPRGANEYMRKAWHEDLDEMKLALYVIKQNGTNQSGESKKYDYKQKVTIVTNAVKNIFRLFQFALNTVQELRGGERQVRVMLPIDFNVRDSQDVIMELQDAEGASSDYRGELHSQLMLVRFGNTAENRRIVEFLETYDKLYGKSGDDIIKAKGLFGDAISARDMIVHDKGWSILKRFSKQEDFLTMSDDKLKAVFDKEVDKVTGIEPQMNLLTGEMLGGSTSLEDAQAKPKGTVGGVQGIIQINQAVATGLITEKSAEALLIEIYGFSPEIADKLIEKNITLQPEAPPALA